MAARRHHMAKRRLRHDSAQVHDQTGFERFGKAAQQHSALRHRFARRTW
jgi:hypothetical protein